MELFNNHKKLFGLATLLFLFLTLFVAILPALNNQKMVRPLPLVEPTSEAAVRGKALYVANGCVACHSQQVRSVEMDMVWGGRPSLAADYARNSRTDFWRNTATLMGTGRTGPDLTNIGTRQPSAEWHLVHLYNPRIVVKESVMPAYPFLFNHKKYLLCGDTPLTIPDIFIEGTNRKVAASQEALDLVAYLQSLKQTLLPDGMVPPEFLYKLSDNQAADPNGIVKKSKQFDGKALYEANCISCHQANGEGLAGAFPPLKGSPIVLSGKLEVYVDIIMNGYDARAEYASMPAVGQSRKWTENEVAAVINYERSSWGNKAAKVTPEEIKEIMNSIKQPNSK